jgi:hypothetical protein
LRRYFQGWIITQDATILRDNDNDSGATFGPTMDDKVHTTTWADTAAEVPEGMKKIADEIKKLIADKK